MSFFFAHLHPHHSNAMFLLILSSEFLLQWHMQEQRWVDKWPVNAGTFDMLIYLWIMAFMNIKLVQETDMAWLMISRVDNARWRSLSNRESGCMKKIVEKGGRKMDIKRVRKQIQCVKERMQSCSYFTQYFCAAFDGAQLCWFTFFHTSHCSTDHPAQEFFQ